MNKSGSIELSSSEYELLLELATLGAIVRIGEDELEDIAQEEQRPENRLLSLLNRKAKDFGLDHLISQSDVLPDSKRFVKYDELMHEFFEASEDSVEAEELLRSQIERMRQKGKL